ncbi:hypothetical protein K523DRAFT_357607 [Schizophyllum commune Tattone D]|nr:hypothetical protein K523DRAFT_357607 [Schizophyllum commune Tattone D]
MSASEGTLSPAQLDFAWARLVSDVEASFRKARQEQAALSLSHRGLDATVIAQR